MDLSTRKPRLTAIAVLLVAVSATTGAYFAYQIHQAHQFNAHIQSKRWDLAAAYPGPYGGFARAMSLQQDRNFQAALKQYAELRDTPEPLRAAASYNTATLYLEWAMTTSQEDAARLTVPLLELAKETYRHLLVTRHDYWPARYNLERVLQLQPDPDDLTPSAQGMPERSPRALGVIESARELP